MLVVLPLLSRGRDLSSNQTTCSIVMLKTLLQVISSSRGTVLVLGYSYKEVGVGDYQITSWEQTMVQLHVGDLLSDLLVAA